ncbi:MAG: signal peptidase II [Clostridium sp.]|nr:signal peptidase II [Clostridium sp.]
MKFRNKNIWSVVMIIIIIAIDQLTKYFAKLYLYPDGVKNFINGFIEFRYAENTGVAFSMLSGGRWFFIVLTTVVLICVTVYMYTKAQKNLWLYWTLGVLISGGIGNLIDRVYLGYVIDFINPTFVNFAVFNIADCAVTLGTISLVAYLVVDLFKKENRNEPKS